MNRFCTKCGCNLEEGAKYCVNCGTRVEFQDDRTTLGGVNVNTKSGIPTWAIVLIVLGSVIFIPLMLVVVLFIIGYNLVNDYNVIDEIRNEVNNYIEENIGSSVVGTINDSLTDGEVYITLNNVYKYDSIDDVKASDGMEYLIFFFEVENISDEKQFISYYDFDGSADDIKVDIKYIASDIEGQSNLSFDMEVGEKVTGFIAFEIDKSWDEFEIHCNRNVFTNKGNLIFKVENVD